MLWRLGGRVNCSAFASSERFSLSYKGAGAGSCKRFEDPSVLMYGFYHSYMRLRSEYASNNNNHNRRRRRRGVVMMIITRNTQREAKNRHGNNNHYLVRAACHSQPNASAETKQERINTNSRKIMTFETRKNPPPPFPFPQSWRYCERSYSKCQRSGEAEPGEVDGREGK